MKFNVKKDIKNLPLDTLSVKKKTILGYSVVTNVCIVCHVM